MWVTTTAKPDRRWRRSSRRGWRLIAEGDELCFRRESVSRPQGRPIAARSRRRRHLRDADPESLRMLRYEDGCAAGGRTNLVGGSASPRRRCRGVHPEVIEPCRTLIRRRSLSSSSSVGPRAYLGLRSASRRGPDVDRRLRATSRVNRPLRRQGIALGTARPQVLPLMPKHASRGLPWDRDSPQAARTSARS